MLNSLTPALFESYRSILLSLGTAEIEAECDRPCRLLVDSDNRSGLEVAYAPFDHINKAARVVIVGITPGRQQMRNALLEAHRILKRGGGDEAAIEGAKVFASFSGPMRSNLVALLDHIGLNELIGLTTTASLWDADTHQVHLTSALRYPVFLNGKNYSGAPAIESTGLLTAHFERWFMSEMLRHAVFVPLGPKVGSLLEMAARKIGIDPARVLTGLPHPSGANAERVSAFLGRKNLEAVSR